MEEPGRHLDLKAAERSEHWTDSAALGGGSLYLRNGGDTLSKVYGIEKNKDQSIYDPLRKAS